MCNYFTPIKFLYSPNHTSEAKKKSKPMAENHLRHLHLYYVIQAGLLYSMGKVGSCPGLSDFKAIQCTGVSTTYVKFPKLFPNIS